MAARRAGNRRVRDARLHRRIGIVGSAVIAVLPLATPVHAQEHGEGAPQHEQADVTWSPAWARVRPWQYAAASAMAVGGLALRFLGPASPSGDGWIEFEEDIIDLVDVRGTTTGHVVFGFGQALYFGSMAYRLVDSALLPGLHHDNWDVAWQLTWIDLQAFATIGAFMWTMQSFLGRARPGFRDCPAFAPGDLDCARPDTRSFIAGHVAVSSAAAGLTCLHHRHLPLYGGKGDDVACYTMIALVPVMAFTRLMNEEHYPSDVLLGLALGLVTGYVLPRTLHYGWDDDGPRAPAEAVRRGHPGLTLTVVPSIAQTSLGGAVVGRF